MKGSETQLISFLEGEKHFVIPVYQRNYDWKMEHCKQLFDDLVKVIRFKRKSHFFGSIVSVYNYEGSYAGEYLVIDGQQRLTTISLLFWAMRNLLRHKKVFSNEDSLDARVHDQFLVNRYQKGEGFLKLIPIEADRQAYKQLCDDDGELLKGSNLTINYNYFYERIQKEEITIDDLFKAIARLEIINITLGLDDNPQLIFESLNSTGLALSEGDKIRNFILMGLPSKKQAEFYKKYWDKIERYTNHAVSMFMRDYLSVKLQETPSINRVYPKFKSYVEDANVDTEELLHELLSYACYYGHLLRGDTTNKALNASIYRLNRLETTVARPFFMEVFHLLDNEKLSLEEVAKIFTITECYLFRRTMCDLPTNALNKIFLALHKEIVRYDGTDVNYVEKYKYALLGKRGNSRFPNDQEFGEAFKTRQVYLMNAKNKIYILERLENKGSIEDKDIYRHIEDKTYSIEHIMPQHLTPKWVEMLGNNYQSIHETWLHRIANLTLTGYNAKYSNNTFTEKKLMKDGFLESGLKMNQWIAQQDAWTLKTLEDRCKKLLSWAFDVWPLPQTTFTPTTKPLDSCDLNDDVNLTGRDIVRFRYKQIEQPVTSWIDMLERVVKMLHAEDKSVLFSLAEEDGDAGLVTWIAKEPKKLRSACEIEKGLYIEKNSSTDMKLTLLQKLFERYNANPDDLVFYLRDEEDALYQEKENALRHTLRKQYWEFALPYIQQLHGNKLFNKGYPTIDCWLDGSFGISGFQVTCIALYDCARVDITLRKSNAKENKSAFDYLLAHKLEIETALDVNLMWKRNDEKKISCVRVELKNVSIKEESDWIQMAKFHAEWSKKLSDVIIPYLRQWQEKQKYGVAFVNKNV